MDWKKVKDLNIDVHGMHVFFLALYGPNDFQLSCRFLRGFLHSVRRPVIDQGPVIDQLVVIGYLFLKDT